MKNHSRRTNRENHNLGSTLLKYAGIGSIVLGSLGLIGYLNAPKQAETNQPEVKQSVKEYGATIFETNPELPNIKENGRISKTKEKEN